MKEDVNHSEFIVLYVLQSRCAHHNINAFAGAVGLLTHCARKRQRGSEKKMKCSVANKSEPVINLLMTKTGPIL